MAACTDTHDPKNFAWSLPFMRAGYSGRGLTYLAVAGISLWAIWRGGEAKGTQQAMSRISQEPGGLIAIWLIALGLASYFVWRCIDAFWDLEAYGDETKGLVARAGMVITGVIHLALGGIAVSSALSVKKGDGQSLLQTLFAMPAGPWIFMGAGICTIGAEFYYLHKAWSENYRDTLHANHFTTHWNPVLRAGVAAQGVVVCVIGGMVFSAGYTANAQQAGGLGSMFDWLSEQLYGQLLVTALCTGLLGFAVFCFVNAAYRIVPRAAEQDVESLGHRLKEKAKSAA